jgi:hypothetical protein
MDLDQDIGMLKPMANTCVDLLSSYAFLQHTSLLESNKITT